LGDVIRNCASTVPDKHTSSSDVAVSFISSFTTNEFSDEDGDPQRESPGYREEHLTTD
jgi:hypothetical protein